MQLHRGHGEGTLRQAPFDRLRGHRGRGGHREMHWVLLAALEVDSTLRMMSAKVNVHKITEKFSQA